MLQSNAIMFGWNRPVPGREGLAGELFGHTVKYYETLKASNKIESWEPVFMSAHGGDLNGYFLLKGTHEQLDTIKSSDEFVDIVMRAGQCLTNVGLIDCYTGTSVHDLMGRWIKTIPQK